MDIYQISQVATLSAEFLDGTGTLADPSTVTLTVTDPSGAAAAYTAPGTVTKDSTGKYHKDITVNAAGVWTYQWNTTGTPATTITGYFVVVAKGSDGIHDSVAPWASLSELGAQYPTIAAATGTEVGLAEWFLQVASNLAFAASGRQFPGLLESVVRPGRRYASSASYFPAWWPMGQSGTWAPWGLCLCNYEPHRDCGCGILSEVWLGDAVQGIIEVRVNGAVVPSTSYAVHDRMYLVRTDGDVWPCCQDMTQDPTLAASTNSFQVSFVRGKMPPPEGRQAVIDLAAQLWNAHSGSACALPDALQQMVREGATFTFDTPQAIDVYNTGIQSWSFFVSAHNPKHRTRRATILSPDVAPRYRHVGTG